MPSTVSGRSESGDGSSAADETPVPKKGEPKIASAGVTNQVADVAAGVAASAAKPKKAYRYPPISLLKLKQAENRMPACGETAMKAGSELQEAATLA